MAHCLVLLVFFSCLACLPRDAGSFRTPVVFPPMDASKYMDQKVELDEELIASSDHSEPEVNHEHPEDDVKGEPAALAQKGLPPRAKPPEHSLALWENDGTICVLARFQAFFTIPYQTATGQEYANIKMPSNKEVTTRGNCAVADRDPQFEVQWPLFKFILHFSRSKDTSSWFVSKIEVHYNTNSPNFAGALNVGRRYAYSTQNISLFLTPMGQSYGCPLHPPLALQIQNSTQKIMVKLKDIRLQSYQLQGNYGPLFRCPQVAMAHSLDPYNYDKTVPVAVGSTLAGLSLATIIGYAIYRSVFSRKVDYANVQ